jgi:hypothetical protein
MNIGLKTTKVDVRRGWDPVVRNLLVSRETRQMLLFKIEKNNTAKNFATTPLASEEARSFWKSIFCS